MASHIPQDNAFNFLRYALSLSLVIAHYTILCDFHPVSYFVPMLVVQAFFIFSGFLTLLSHADQPFSIHSFVRKRMKRLLPSYIFVILLCAIAGGWLSVLPLRTYLTETNFYKYLASNLLFLNFLQPSLPGVFMENPHTDAVNGSLWTMKVEILFYAVVPLLLYLFRKFRPVSVLVALFLGSLLWNECFAFLYRQSGKPLYEVIRHQLGGQFIYFAIGMTIYFYFNRILKYGQYIFPLSVLLFVAGFFTYRLEYIQSMAYGILLIGLAYRCTILRRANHWPNLTYGLYLYHFPVIQTLLSLRIIQPNPCAGLLLTLVLTTALAAVSYYVIEPSIRRLIHYPNKP